MENDACSYRRFLDGDESAFDEIQAAFFNRLVFFINRYLQDYAASEDVAIDVLAELAVKKKYNFKSSLSTYLFTMAKSRALTQLKKRKRRGEALHYMKREGQRPAFLCSGDIYAIRLLGTLKEQGYREKTDFGIMGFDYIDLIQKWSPRLCTVDNHVEEIGKSAAELLIQMIQGTGDERGIEIPYEIVDGETL